MIKQDIKPEIRKVQGFDYNTTFGITIPKSIAKILQIVKGTFLKISLHDQQIVMEKI